MSVVSYLKLGPIPYIEGVYIDMWECAGAVKAASARMGTKHSIVGVG